jgi:hypothetical protein
MMVAFMKKFMGWMLLLPFVGAAVASFMFFEDISWLAPIAGFFAGGVVFFAMIAVLEIFLPDRIFCAITGASSTDGTHSSSSSYAEGVGRMHILGQK